MQCDAQYKPLPNDKFAVADDLWSGYIDRICGFSIPFLWDAINDALPQAERSHALENYRIAAGISEGAYYGAVFQDSDVTKWLESAALSLIHHPDPELERLIDQTIDTIAAAQQPDGYLNTYFTLCAPDSRWTNLLEGHELYCAGHLIEAATAYYSSTGKKKLMDVACRFADLICETFGHGDGKIDGYGGHPEIELALVKLYDITQRARYLETARFFVSRRGKEPEYLDMERKKRNGVYIHPEMAHYGREFAQAHAPAVMQTEAVGHAVRAMYLYSGMADVAMRTNDEALYRTLKTIWKDIVHKKLYFTGAIGASAFGEAFSTAFDLPNDRAYAETCASVGLIMFAAKMLQMELNGEYGDVIELALYNVILASMQLDGKAFFYVNPLEVYPELCGRKDTNHVLPERQKWFACSCCPPNAIRTILSIGSYSCSISKDAISVHLYIGGVLTAEISGTTVRLQIQSDYADRGTVKYRVEVEQPTHFAIHFRIPSWSDEHRVCINGSEYKTGVLKNGYLTVRRIFRTGDIVELDFGMKVSVYRTRAEVRGNAGKVAIRRGPLVYCIESPDNGVGLHLLRIRTSTAMKTEYRQNLLQGVTIIRAGGFRLIQPDGTGDRLYFPNQAFDRRETDILMIPYHKWANRGISEMRVWIEEA